MSTVQWGKRHDHRIQLSAGDQLLAEFEIVDENKETAEVAGKQWTYELSSDEARATDGSVEWVAQAPKGFKKSKRFVATIGERSIDFINEQKSDWIIDENDTKLGQFSGANNGVRNVAVEFEPEVALDKAEQVYLAWLSRIALEQRLVGLTWILTLVLLILTPLVLFLFFN
ncbi:hypothetical protein WG915_09940 [Corynebacterium sp. H128]|uniref:hypothetical protein n=1 Tax=Corynebacterium sp. H128 TaxID=3133427 RepID=UPI0030AA2F25